MADELSTSTGADEATDTSVSDDTSTDTDVSLDDIEVDETDMQDNDDEAEDESDGEETSEEATDETSEEEAESDDTDESTEEAEPELSDEQRQAQYNREMYEKRQQEKQARVDRVKQDQAQYLAEAQENGDPLEQAVRQLQIDGYNNTVDANTNKLTNSYERAVNDFPILKSSDPVIKAEVDAAIDAFQAMNVQIDNYGNPTAVNGDLYATLQAKADAIEKLTNIRAAQQANSKNKEKSKTLTRPQRAPKEPKEDPDMAAFDEEANS
jgi:hypothetical protein